MQKLNSQSIAQLTAEFLNSGGSITQCKPGATTDAKTVEHFNPGNSEYAKTILAKRKYAD